MQQEIELKVYVDGFNFYHALDDIIRNAGKNLQFYKWLDWKKLSKKIVSILSKLLENRYSRHIPSLKLVGTNFYTARPDTPRNVSQKRLDRYDTYIKALEATGINVIKGHFTKPREHTLKFTNKHIENDRIISKCKVINYKCEEKESDVNMAIDMVADAFLGNYDIAIAVTADRDQAPPLKLINEHFPKKQVINSSFNYINKRCKRELNHLLVSVCKLNNVYIPRSFVEIKTDMIENSILPEEITKQQNGSMLKTKIKMPYKYRESYTSYQQENNK